MTKAELKEKNEELEEEIFQLKKELLRQYRLVADLGKQVPDGPYGIDERQFLLNRIDVLEEDRATQDREIDRLKARVVHWAKVANNTSKWAAEIQEESEKLRMKILRYERLEGHVMAREEINDLKEEVKRLKRERDAGDAHKCWDCGAPFGSCGGHY